METHPFFITVAAGIALGIPLGTLGHIALINLRKRHDRRRRITATMQIDPSKFYQFR
jgi:NhaP-type Na+/H+ or K+/H+ antiporter